MTWPATGHGLTTSAPRCVSRPTTATVAPPCSSCAAQAAPMPRVPPVTMARLPANRWWAALSATGVRALPGPCVEAVRAQDVLVDLQGHGARQVVHDLDIARDHEARKLRAEEVPESC